MAETRISRAAFVRALSPGRKLRLIHCLLGPVAPEDQPRTVLTATPRKLTLRTPRGSVSSLHLETGDECYLLDGVGWGIRHADMPAGKWAAIYAPAGEDPPTG